MWFDKSVMYQIYPLGFCGAPKENDGKEVSRILKLNEHIEYFKELKISSILFNPIFESDNHGYDTRDFRKLDSRLGSNEDFKSVCRLLKKNNIKIVLDAVFNHVGRGFWAFKDVLLNRQNSQYKDWFSLQFDHNNAYNDGLSYEGWEGHFELVKLNLKNIEVREYIYNTVKFWIDEFEIDGLRLDVAYCLEQGFLRELREFVEKENKEFALIGETLFGDYRQIVNDGMLHSCTNYECYKGLFSSMNELNCFEISYSLNRQFGYEDWTIYKNLRLMNFVDNHDVTRIFSILKNKEHIYPVYALLFTMPGFPSIYYGSEFGIEGQKSKGDDYALRPEFKTPVRNDILDHVKKLIYIRDGNEILSYGGYKNIIVTNKQMVFSRKYGEQQIIVAINIDDKEIEVNLNLGEIEAEELITNQNIKFSNTLKLPACGALILRVK